MDIQQQQMLRRRRDQQPPPGVADSLRLFQPTHASVEDVMREALYMLDLLPADQRRVSCATIQIFMTAVLSCSPTSTCTAYLPAF
jgi:hypothetical protein